MPFNSHPTERKLFFRKPTKAETAAGAFVAFLSTGEMAPPALAQTATQGRVTADRIYRGMPGNPVRLSRLGDNPVVRDGGVLSLREVHATRERLAPLMEDWAENDFENALRLINGLRAGDGATSDPAVIARIEALLAATPRAGGTTQEVNITDLLTASGYTVGTGVQVSLEAVSGGESQTYVAGTQADGPDGVKLIPLTDRAGVQHDGLLVEGDGNGANESIRIRVSRMVRRAGQVITETVAADIADHCGNAFLLPYLEVASVAPQETAPNPCPPRSRITVSGPRFPERGSVTVVYNVDMNRVSELTLANEQCPHTSLPEVCPDCTRVVASRLTQEVADVKNLRLGILSAQSLDISDHSLNVEIPSVIPVRTASGVVYIDLPRAIRDHIVLVSLSCPRTESERTALPRMAASGSDDHNVTIDLEDWQWAASNTDADGFTDLPLVYNGSRYVRGRLHSSN